MDRKPVNKNIPPKTARIRAIAGWIFVLVSTFAGIYWLSKL